MTQGIQEQIGVLPTIKPELHLFEICGKMLRADVMPRTSDRPLEERECVLDGVSVDVSDYINLGTMIDRFVLVFVESGFNHRFRVADPIISDDSIHIHTDAIFDVLSQGVRFGVLDVIEPDVAAPLPDADYDFFVGAASGAPATLHAADIRFVHFDSATEHLLAGFNHGGSDAMAEIPCCFVADSDGPLNLAGRHTFLGFTQQQSSHEPFRQRQVRIIEDRSNRHGELVSRTIPCRFQVR